MRTALIPQLSSTRPPSTSGCHQESQAVPGRPAAYALHPRYLPLRVGPRAERPRPGNARTQSGPGLRARDRLPSAPIFHGSLTRARVPGRPARPGGLTCTCRGRRPARPRPDHTWRKWRPPSGRPSGSAARQLPAGRCARCLTTLCAYARRLAAAVDGGVDPRPGTAGPGRGRPALPGRGRPPAFRLRAAGVPGR